MNPTIATILCGLFIIIIFYKEFKNDKKSENILWLPLIWMVYCSSRSIGSWINPTDINANQILEGSIYDRYFLVFLMFLAVIYLHRSNISWINVFRNNIYLLFLFLYMGISILWSDSIEISFRRWIRSIGDILMALVVVTDKNAIESVKGLIKRNAFILIPISVLLIKYYPHIGVAYDPWEGVKMYIGVTDQKNELGKLALISGVYFIYNCIIYWSKGKKQILGEILVFIMAVWILFGHSDRAVSKTSLNLLFFSSLFLIACIWLNPEPKKIYNYLIAILIIIMFINISMELFYNNSLLNIFVLQSGRNMTFTGRTEIWNALIEIGSKNFVFGKGFGGFWLGDLTPELYDKIPWKITSGHNGYLDVFVELGIVGLFLLTLVIFATFRKIKKLIINDYDNGILMFIYLLIIIIHNVTESSMIKPTKIIWFLFLLLSVIPTNSLVSINEDIK